MLKKLSFFIVVILASGFHKPNSPKVHWHSVEKGMLEVETSHKIAFIDAYTNWCGYCKKMDTTTFADAEVVQLIQENFVPIKFNPEIRRSYLFEGDTLKGSELLKKLNGGRNKGFPSYFFYFPEKKRTVHVSGYMKKTQFIKTAEKVLSIPRNN